MVLFEPEIVFAVIVMSEVIVKEVNCHENTGHVTYIEAGEKCERKADNKKLKLFFCYQTLDSQSNKRKQNQIVDPHHDGIRGKRITG